MIKECKLIPVLTKIFENATLINVSVSTQVENSITRITLDTDCKRLSSQLDLKKK